MEDSALEKRIEEIKAEISEKLPKRPSDFWSDRRLFNWLCKKAMMLDVSDEASAEYLRREMIRLHEKYHLPLDSRAYDDSLRDWEQSFDRYRKQSKYARRCAELSPNFDKTLEKVADIDFFATFAAHYWSKTLLGKLMRSVDKK